MFNPSQSRGAPAGQPGSVPRQQASNLGPNNPAQNQAPRRKFSDVLKEAPPETFRGPMRIDVDFGKQTNRIELGNTANPPIKYAAEYFGTDLYGKEIPVLPTRKQELNAGRWTDFRFPDANSLTVQLSIGRMDGKDFLLVKNRMKNGEPFSNEIMHGVMEKTKQAIQASEENKKRLEQQEYKLELELKSGGMRTLEWQNKVERQYSIVKYTELPKVTQDLYRLRANVREQDKIKRAVEAAAGGRITITRR